MTSADVFDYVAVAFVVGEVDVVVVVVVVEDGYVTEVGAADDVVVGMVSGSCDEMPAAVALAAEFDLASRALVSGPGPSPSQLRLKQNRNSDVRGC